MEQTIPVGWLDVSGAATYTGSGESTIRAAAQSGELRGSKGPRAGTRGKWRFKRDDLDRWVEGLPPRKGGAA